MSLTRWLELEGRRVAAVEDLWTDLVFAGQKLGFTAIKLTLADGERTWEAAEQPETALTARFAFQQGRFGALELRGFSPAHAPAAGGTSLFEILSELLAESWTKAAAQWHQQHQTALRFDARIPLRRGWLSHVPLPGGPQPSQ